MSQWRTVDQVIESVFGDDWLGGPDHLKAREWVRREFYDGGVMPSDHLYDTGDSGSEG